MQLTGISARTTSGFHPQANGQAEITNKILRQYIRVYAKTSDDWPAGLVTAEMAINNAHIDGAKHSPYELNSGYTPCLVPDTYWEANDRPGQIQPAKAWYKKMMQDWEHARLTLQSINDKEFGRAN